MTPIWIFPAYPLLIVGPMAGVLVPYISQKKALDIVVGGVALQGIGFMISVMVYSAYIYRLMTQKLPQESVRPSMFVSVGPSAFTVSGLITMAESASHALPSDFMGDGDMAAFVLKIIANWMGVWFWGYVYPNSYPQPSQHLLCDSLAVWFFLVSVGAHYSCVRNREMQFAMTWYSFIFPNCKFSTRGGIPPKVHRVVNKLNP
jgi:tellurite resistance protein TehA-like permease